MGSAKVPHRQGRELPEGLDQTAVNPLPQRAAKFFTIQRRMHHMTEIGQDQAIDPPPAEIITARGPKISGTTRIQAKRTLRDP